MEQLMVVRVPVPSHAARIRLSPSSPARLAQGRSSAQIPVSSWREDFEGQSNGEQGKNGSALICR